MYRFLLVAVLGIGCLPSWAADVCLTYEPSTVSLRGVVKAEEFPGPPNYESVAKGDAPEKVWILALASPVCVSGRDSWGNGPVNTVRNIQLVVPAPLLKSIHPGQVEVTGRLFGAHTGHHRTKVLLDVISFKGAA